MKDNNFELFPSYELELALDTLAKRISFKVQRKCTVDLEKETFVNGKKEKALYWMYVVNCADTTISCLKSTVDRHPLDWADKVAELVRTNLKASGGLYDA